jgi:hypothetical protein
MAYGITSKGARLLREHGHLINDGADWTEKTKRAGPVFIDHALVVSHFMVSLELACRRTSGIELIRETKIIAEAPAETQAARESLRWIVDETVHGKRQT